MSMFGSYWQYRRTRLRVKRPELAFLELMLFSSDRKTGEQRSPLASMRELYKLGQYHTDKVIDWMGDMAKKWKSDPESMIDKSQRLSAAEWKKLEDAADVDRDDVDPEDKMFGQKDKGSEDPRVTRMNVEETGEDLARPGMRIRFTPDRPINRLGTQKVGPDRQIRLSDEPFPLAKPGPRRTVSQIEGPKDLSKSASNDNDIKEIKGPSKPAALESPEASKSRRASVTKIQDAPSLRTGKDAADRGAEKAREIAQKRAAKAKTKGSKQDQAEI